MTVEASRAVDSTVVPDGAGRDLSVTWWARPGLEAIDSRLVIAGVDAEAVARERGTPLLSTTGGGSRRTRNA